MAQEEMINISSFNAAQIMLKLEYMQKDITDLKATVKEMANCRMDDAYSMEEKMQKGYVTRGEFTIEQNKNKQVHTLVHGFVYLVLVAFVSGVIALVFMGKH